MARPLTVMERSGEGAATSAGVRAEALVLLRAAYRKVDVRLPGKGNSNPAVQGRSTTRWTRTSRLSIKTSLSLREATPATAWFPCSTHQRQGPSRILSI